jgi:hypothetical protein
MIPIKKQHTSFFKNRGAEGGVGIVSLCEIKHNNQPETRLFQKMTAKIEISAVKSWFG